MADVRQLIQKILSDPKIAANGNLASKVYNDEPILFTAPQMAAFTPPMIREMRKIAMAGGSDAKIFHDQGKFMESFEDDFEYHGEFVQYFPTYQSMTDAQARGYFSWRTRVRNGTIGKTSLSFAFVYIYELLNRIGVRSPEDGFHALRNFWTAYREIDSRIDGYAATWLKDYVVYNNLDKSLLEGLPDLDVDRAVAVLLDHRSHGAGEVFRALVSLSSYDLGNSRFFALHPEDVESVVHRVFSVVSDYYDRNPKANAREKIFGRVCVNPYPMFRSAVFHHRPFRGRRVYEIGGFHKYVCRDGDWSCERFVWYGRNNKRIGALLKTVDYLMRLSRGYKSALQPGKTNKTLTGKIEKAIAAFEREKRENAPPRIDIDLSKLHGIRRAALATRDRLLVEEPEEEARQAPPPETPGPDAGLNDAELRFLRGLLYGESRDDLRSRGLMASVLIDAINEKLFDAFGDTVLDRAETGGAVVGEYEETLKGMFPQ